MQKSCNGVLGNQYGLASLGYPFRGPQLGSDGLWLGRMIGLPHVGHELRKLIGVSGRNLRHHGQHARQVALRMKQITSSRTSLFERRFFL